MKILARIKHDWFMLSVCLVAFAANSFLCRLALSRTSIEPLLFTNLRLFSGAIILVLLCFLLNSSIFRSIPECPGYQDSTDKTLLSRVLQWQGGVYLLLYMLGFSLAYQELATGTGALLLFGAVQLTMTLIGFYRREFPSARQWLGWGIALSGLILLATQHMAVNASDSSWFGIVWMAISGIGWGSYTAYGQTKQGPPSTMNQARLHNLDSDSTTRTRSYFTQASLLMGVLTLVAIVIQPERWHQLETQLTSTNMGIWLAIGSGAITSALGYILWYRLLPNLSTVEAASSQLMVPILAAVMGILLLSEPFTASFIIASILAIVGLLLVVIPTNIRTLF